MQNVIVELFAKYLEEKVDPKEVREAIDDFRDNCIYADMEEFEASDFNTWEEYVDCIAGYMYGFRDVFEDILAEFEDYSGEKIEDEELEDALFDVFFALL